MHVEHGRTYFNGQLLDHIRRQRTAEALEILKNTPNASQLVDTEERTLLHYVAQWGNHEVVRYLMSSGAVIDPQDKQGKSPLMLATDQATVNFLLDYQANIHLRDKNGHCALQLALESEYGRLFLWAIRLEYLNDVEKIAKKLIELKCSIHAALIFRNARLIELLLENGCPLVQSSSSLRPGDLLVEAVKRCDLAYAKALLDHGVDVDAEDSEGNTALSSCRAQPDRILIDDPHPLRYLEVLQLLVDRGANLNKSSKAHSGEMQAGRLLRWGTREVIRILLKAVDLNVRDESGRTALHHMADNDSPDIFAELNGRECDANARDNDGSTPLHRVCVVNVSSVISLIDMGVDIHAKNIDGMTALMSIWQRCRVSMFLPKVLLEKSKQSIEYLLCRGADIQTVASDGKFSILKKCLMCKITGKYHVLWMPSVLAHLVMIEARGTPILKHVRKRISKRNCLRKGFDVCKKQLKRMKKDRVWKSISLYQLLIERDFKIERYARNKRLLLKLDRIQFKNKYAPYFRYSLRSRFLRVAKIVEMRKIVAASLCSTIGVCHVVADKIISYIDGSDLQKMICKEYFN